MSRFFGLWLGVVSQVDASSSSSGVGFRSRFISSCFDLVDCGVVNIAVALLVLALKALLGWDFGGFNVTFVLLLALFFDD